MANKTNIRIGATDETKTGVASAVANLQHLDREISSMTRTFDKLKNIGFLTSIAFGLKKVADEAVKCANEYGEWEIKALKLQGALKGNESEFNKLVGYIDSISKTTTISKDSIESLVTEMVGLGKTSTEIEAITNASIKLSETTGNDLTSSFNLLQGTLTGSSGKLEKLIPEIGSLTTEQLKSGSAIDLINEKLAGFSSNIGESYLVKVKGLKESFGDLREELGARTSKALTPMIELITKIIEGWTKSLEGYRKYKEAIDKDAGERTTKDKLEIATQQLNQAEADKKLRLGAVGLADYNQYAKFNPRATQADYLKALTTFLSSTDINENIGRLNGEIKALKAQLEAETKVQEKAQAKASGSSGMTATELQALIKANTPVDFDMTGGYTQATLMEDLYTFTDDFIESVGTMNLNDVVATANATTMEGKYFDEPSGQLKEQVSYSGGGFDLGALGSIFEKVNDFIGGIGSSISSLASVQGVLNPLTTIITGFMDVVGPMIDVALKPILDLLTKIGGTIGELLVPVFEVMTPIISVLAETLGNILLPIIKMFAPVIKLIADINLWLFNKIIRPILNGLIVAFNFISNAFAALYNTISTVVRKLTFGVVKMGSMEYRAWDEGTIAEVKPTSISTNTDSSSSASNAGQAATYNAQGDIILNIYNYGNVVGDNGIREFAYIIRDEMNNMNYQNL